LGNHCQLSRVTGVVVIEVRSKKGSRGDRGGRRCARRTPPHLRVNPAAVEAGSHGLRPYRWAELPAIRSRIGISTIIPAGAS
jgi:hypothetical protein